VLVGLACFVGPQAAEAGDPAAAPNAAPDAAPEFVYCAPAKFANCTKAKCKPKPDGGYSCDCHVDDRYSATAAEFTCLPATATTVQSRYHPISSYQVCADRATDSPLWAWCLGYGCTIDASGKRAWCDCPAPPANVPPFPYVITTPTFLPEGCASQANGEVYSSATPDGVAQITAFLQQQPGHHDLEPPIVVPGPARP
jgi:hypothetical protein